jgi:NitT/TauT family transport system ATP-binding protein
MTGMQRFELPSYLEQSAAVRDRFARLRRRPVVLEVSRLNKHFDTRQGQVTALRDISFVTHRREFVCVIGPSGCGKSTLIRILAGLEAPSSGAVLLDGKAVDGPGPDRGMVFQGYTLFPWLTVKKNVMFGLEQSGRGRLAAEEEAMQWIELVGLAKFAKCYPHQLSGGMKQRVGIARAYADDPQILLMDEPFGQLDAQTRYVMEMEIQRVWQQEKRTVVFVTNNIEEAVFLADRIILLSNRPAVVKAEYSVHLPRPRDTIAPDFLKLRAEVSANTDLAM